MGNLIFLGYEIEYFRKKNANRSQLPVNFSPKLLNKNLFLRATVK